MKNFKSLTVTGLAPGSGRQIKVRSGPLTTTLLLGSNGRILSKVETTADQKDVWEYAYDTSGRLIRALLNGKPVEEYRYGSRGERVADCCACRGPAWRALSYDRAGRLERAGDLGFLYDSQGRLGAVRGPRGGMHLVYDDEGGLAEIHLPNGKVLTQRTGPGGLPLEKLVNGRAVERFHWLDMTRLAAWQDLRRGVALRFAWGRGRAPVAVRLESPGGEAEYRLGADQTGTVKAVADAWGNLVQRIQYDSFGNVLANTNPAFWLPLGFAGGLADRNTGLVRFGWRDYDPAVGRFTAPDPLGDTGGDHDPWEYCVDDPVNSIDPRGLDSEGWNFTEFFKKIPGIGKLFETGEIFKNAEEMYQRGQTATKDIMPDPEGTTQKVWDYSDQRLRFFTHDAPRLLDNSPGKR